MKKKAAKEKLPSGISQKNVVEGKRKKKQSEKKRDLQDMRSYSVAHVRKALRKVGLKLPKVTKNDFYEKFPIDLQL